MKRQPSRPERHGNADGYIAATLGKEFDAVRYFNQRLALHEVTEDERPAYTTAFKESYTAEAKAKRDHEAGTRYSSEQPS